MARYRKRPVEIEAIRWLDNEAEMLKFLGLDYKDFDEGLEFKQGQPFTVETLEGTMMVYPGAFVIRGVVNEFYPCDPEVFKQTYEYIGD